MEGFSRQRAAVLAFLLAVSGVVNAQGGLTTFGPGEPDWNVNIIGPTPDPNDVRDLGLRQQNEPACAIRPGDSDCIICAYNDYRTLDVLAVQDAWQGVSMSCNAGKTWLSRIAPGSGADLRAPVDAQFAADPRLVALPGMTILNFIGGVRGQDRGLLAIQHWLEANQEDADFYEPALQTITAEIGTEGRFIDKPEILGVLDKGNKAGSVTLTHVMENPELGTITRSYPSGTLYLAYAVFTGSQSVKVQVKTSKDWGQTWNNKSTKLTESQNLVSGISMAEKDGTVMAVWRQAGDVNDEDAMYFALTTNEGKSWTKPEVLTPICAFDQPTATTAVADSANKFGERVTFRTNDFPWVTNDGENFYMFYSDRKTSPTQACDGSGVAKVYMRYSADGSTWSNPVPIDNSVESAPGYQFMPSAFGANGKVQVAWYDTRRENIVDPTLDFIADYSPDGSTVVNRKIDVYTAKVAVIDGDVTISPSTRVSQYRSVYDPYELLEPGAEQPTLFELEASFGNAMMYGSGFLAFIGDYIAVGGQEFRRDGAGGWEDNAPARDPGSPLSNKADFYVAWADHRDLRGDFLYGSPGSPPTEYTPPDNLPPPTAVNNETETEILPAAPDADSAREETLLANGLRATPLEATAGSDRRSTEGVEDTPVDPTAACVIDLDRTRDANIYGALIRDADLRLSAPTPSKPLSGIQRAYPVGLTNVNSLPVRYRLHIDNQPSGDPLFNRASFLQQPAIPPFTGAPLPELIEDLLIPSNSTFARTVFVNSNDPGATVTVNAYEGTCAIAADDVGPDEFLSCPIVASIQLGGTAQTGTLLQPDYESGVCDDAPSGSACYEDVLLAELHNPRLENPRLENPRLENPELENLVFANPRLENPRLENPELENTVYENPRLENFGYENPRLENPELENTGILNPRLENPRLENPRLENTAIGEAVYYADVTAALTNDGNVTTAYSADLTITSSLSDPGIDSQLIAWTQYVTPTSRDCALLPFAENQVLAVVQNPDSNLDVANINQPFEGELSFIAVPGQTVFVTHRIYGTVAELEAISIAGFTASSQASNCIDEDGSVGDEYFCETSLRVGNEQILLDTTGPVFTDLADGEEIPTPPIPANVPGDAATGTIGGACVDLVGSGLVAATDESSVTISCSLVDAPDAQLCTSSDPTAGLPIQAATLLSPGPTPVSCTATDEAGNETTIQIGIKVADTGAPIINVFPTAPVNVAADDMGQASVDFESLVSATDVPEEGPIDPNPVVACTATPGNLMSEQPLAIGMYSVSCTATDASGNPSSAIMYSVNVNDVTDPVFDSNVPGPITLEAGAPTGNVVSYTPPTATDNSGSATVVCLPAPGSLFVVGATPVVCTATDPSGNTATASFNVTIQDTTAPGITLLGANPLSVAAGTPFVDPGATVTDTADPTVTVTVTGTVDTNVVGTYTLTYTATDASGNSATATRTVNVTDGTAPVIVVPGGTVFVQLEGPDGAVFDYTSLVSISDAVDPNPTLSCIPTSGSQFPIGETTVTCTGTDASGNSSTASFGVQVGYAGGIGITPKKLNVKSGSSNPLSWAWQNENGENIDTSGDIQRLRIVECGTSNVIVDIAADPGSSGFRIKSDLSWEYNWQVTDESGANLGNGNYCATVESSLTGQMLSSPSIRVR